MSDDQIDRLTESFMETRNKLERVNDGLRYALDIKTNLSDRLIKLLLIQCENSEIANKEVQVWYNINKHKLKDFV